MTSLAPKGRLIPEKDLESPQADLLGDLNAETWLYNRLKDHNVDVYARGLEVACLRDRIAAAILDNRYTLIVVGRFNGRPENYEAAFERIFGLALKDTPPGKALHASHAKTQKQRTGSTP